jgi:uncharacterized protein (UPF0332 family)
VTLQERESLVRYRLERAAHALRQAEALGDIGAWDGAVNRAYDTMFYAALAMLVRHGFEAHRHAGVPALVDRELVGRGLRAREQVASLREASRIPCGGGWSPLRRCTHNGAGSPG